MPEIKNVIPWENVAWDNIDKESGGGPLVEKPYYFKRVGSGGNTKIVLTAAVPSEEVSRAMHATEHLRINKE